MNLLDRSQACLPVFALHADSLVPSASTASRRHKAIPDISVFVSDMKGDLSELRRRSYVSYTGPRSSSGSSSGTSTSVNISHGGFFCRLAPGDGSPAGLTKLLNAVDLLLVDVRYVGVKNLSVFVQEPLLPYLQVFLEAPMIPQPNRQSCRFLPCAAITLQKNVLQTRTPSIRTKP